MVEEIDREGEEETTEETQTEDSTEEETTPDDPSKKDEEVDYEALARAERERADAAEALIVKNKKTEKRHKNEDEDEVDEDEKPLTRREFLELSKTQQQAVQKEMQEVRALEIARTNTSSEQEARAVLTFWKTRVIPTGNLDEDVLFAIGGLNHKKVVSKNLELARALRGKSGEKTDAAGTHRDAPEGSTPKMSAGDASAYKQAGFEWDGKRRLFKKSLGKDGKKTLWKDHKSGRTWVS